MRGRWLLVLDNADDAAVLSPTDGSHGRVNSSSGGDSSALQQHLSRCIPSSSHGSVLVTSQTKRAAMMSMEFRSEELGEDDAETLSSMGMIGLARQLGGKYEEAEAMNRQTLARKEKVLGSEHPDTLTRMSNLAGVLHRQGKYEEAEAMHRKELAICEKVLGHKNPSTLTSVYSLAYLLTYQQRYNESLTLYKRAWAGYEAVLGKDHPTTRACHQHYADALALQKQHRLAVSPTTTSSTQSARTGKGSKLLRGLVKIGIRSSKSSAR